MFRIVCAVVTGFGACALGVDAFAEGDDAAIAARIETLHSMEAQLSAFNIVTTSSNGFVVMTGAVRDDIQKELAEELARSVKGVRDVVNELVVVSNAENHDLERSWRQKVLDRSVRASVRTRLFYHKHLRGLRLAVHVENNVATLTGVVSTKEQKRRVGEIAYETRGVDLILNELLVRPKAQLSGTEKLSRAFSDEWVEKRVESSILMTRGLSIRKVHVEVDDGVCILTGIVDSMEQKSLAGRVADDVQGVDLVENAIIVRGRYDAPDPVPKTSSEPAAVQATKSNSLPTVTSSPLPPQ